jgi:hypothetical protein
MLKYEDLKAGDQIRIRFGGSGATQFAVVKDVTKQGNVRVFKYSPTRGIWKGPLKLWPGEQLYYAELSDRNQRRAPLPA